MGACYYDIKTNSKCFIPIVCISVINSHIIMKFSNQRPYLDMQYFFPYNVDVSIFRLFQRNVTKILIESIAFY